MQFSPLVCYHFRMIKKYSVIRYIISGATAALANFSLLYFLVQVLGVWYLLASVLSFCFGLVVSYLMQKFFTFRDHSTKGLVGQFSVFFIYNLIMLGVNTLLMYLAVDVLGLWYLLAQVSITILTAFVNYFVFSRGIFAQNRKFGITA